jgi:ribose-phosphate pyrophosphokinase
MFRDMLVVHLAAEDAMPRENDELHKNTSTLPRRIQLFASQSSADLGQKVATLLGIELAATEERQFEGGEHKMRPIRDVRGCETFIVDSLNGDAHLSANDKLCRLLFFIGTLRDAGAASVTACVPYLCYARKDRRTQTNDPITTRYVAMLFEAMGTDRVVVLDVHNESAFDNAFRCNTVRIEGSELFIAPLADAVDPARCVVASPDIGGVKRAQRLRESLAAVFNCEVGFGFMEKRRTGGVVSGDAFVGEVAGSDVVIYDDMIVSGATIAKATLAARAAGARKVVVAASHATFTPAASQLFAADGPDLVLVSDSVTLSKTFKAKLAMTLRVCSSAPVLARTIREIAKLAP